MKRLTTILASASTLVPMLAPALAAQDDARFQPLDVFQLEYAADPQISPDTLSIVYVRTFFDIMKDATRTNLWLIGKGDDRPLTTGNQNDRRPRWSPDGGRILYASNRSGSTQLYVRWMDTGQTAKLTNFTQIPGNFAWSPDGKWIAFAMHVPMTPKPFAKMPAKPKGATWAAPAKVITKLNYRADGRGYLPDGYRQLFVLPAQGGTPRQLTTGSFQHGGTPSWTPDGKFLIFSANRHPDAEYNPRNSEVYELRVTDGRVRALTKRKGPDQSPVVSPEGDKIAFTGFDDRFQGYQVTHLYVMNRDGSDVKMLATKLDRSVRAPRWHATGANVWFLYDDRGRTHLGITSLTGDVGSIADDIGGTTLGRPYTSGSYSVAGSWATYTRGTTTSPANVAATDGGADKKTFTHLNDDLLGHKLLGTVEEVTFASSHDKRKIQGWIVKPPNFDPKKKYPLILEIHGGPFANYGFRFSAEIQLYAAAGYVVLYANPRGSTSYGEEFGNLIHHNYPGEDYDDLMSGVDAVIAKGYVDSKRLFVTGGSGGGVLTSWIVGKTNRFRAAVAAKPVINWYSFVLTSDRYSTFSRYWFPGFPWVHTEHYMKRSPISLVGNVTTPTMLLTGEADLRTPIGESEQFYQALKLRKIDTALVRIPGAYHGIASRPSRLIAKVAHILEWFRRHDVKK